MHTIEVVVPLSDLTRPIGWFRTMVRVVRELKEKGVPVVGTTGIRAVEWGTLEQHIGVFESDSDAMYVFRWTGKVLKDNSEKELI